MKKDNIIKFIHYFTDIEFRNSITYTVRATETMYLLTILFVVNSMFINGREITDEYVLYISSPIIVLFGVAYYLYPFFNILKKGMITVYSGIVSFAILCFLWLIMPDLLLPLSNLKTNNYAIYIVLFRCAILLFCCRFFITIMKTINKKTQYVTRGEKDMYHLISISKEQNLKIKISYYHKYKLPTILLNRLCIENISFNVDVIADENAAEYIIEFCVGSEHPMFAMSIGQLQAYFKQKRIYLDVGVDTEINI